MGFGGFGVLGLGFIAAAGESVWGVLAGGHGISLVVDLHCGSTIRLKEGPRVAVGGFVGFRQDNKVV